MCADQAARQDVAMSRIRATVLAAALTMVAALLGAPAAHAGNGFFTSQDLTASIGAPPGIGEPVGWTTPWDLKRHFAYLGGDSQIVIASAGVDNVWSWTAPLRREPTGGFLTAFSYSWDHSSRIVYDDGVQHHLIELWSSDSSPTWQKIDLTATHNGPHIDGDAHGYEQDGQMHIVFHDWNPAGPVWEAVFTPGGDWTFTDITAVSGIKPASNYGWWLTARSLGADGEAIGYIAADGYPHVLFGQRGRWLDTQVGVPADTHYYTVNSMAFLRYGHLQRYAFRYITSDFHMHEAAWNVGRWTDTDVTAVTHAPPRVVPNTSNDSYLWNADGSEHMFTCGDDGAVREYVRTRDGRWFLWTDTGPVADTTSWVAGFTAPDDTVQGTETEYYVYYAADRHVVIAGLTVPFEA
jgi:hypothetical protein